MSIDELYRELILDHYKSPRHHGHLADADAVADGQNPLCGDEISITLKLGGRRRDDRGVCLRRSRLRDQPGLRLDAR